jgi:hypothetical protein
MPRRTLVIVLAAVLFGVSFWSTRALRTSGTECATGPTTIEDAAQVTESQSPAREETSLFPAAAPEDTAGDYNQDTHHATHG